MFLTKRLRVTHPTVFEQFTRRVSISDGASVYDFLGGAIKSSYKSGWDKNVQPAGREVMPGYPGLSEWTVDWTACLLAALMAKDEFTIAELGAGYGQWMVTAIMAAKRVDPQIRCCGYAMEADPIHYQWLRENAYRNLTDFDDVDLKLVHGAAGLDGHVEFPALADPSADYGASYSKSGSQGQADNVVVRSLSLHSIYEQLGNESVDLLHVDIQGAEEDLIEDREFLPTMQRTKVALFGTHRSEALHERVREQMTAAGFTVAVEWPRRATIKTRLGQLTTVDGALLAVRNDLEELAGEIVDFDELRVIERIS